MFARWVVRLWVLICLFCPLFASALTGAPGAMLPADYKPWPRELKNGAITYRIYEPQTESWNGNDLRFRAAVAVTAESGTRYGIAFGQARTWTELGTGLVKLESIKIERVNFPTAADGGEEYLRDLQHGATGTWLVRREQLDPSQAVAQRAPVRNDPPRMFVSYSPALLVLIDGQPVLRRLPDAPFERVINTPALLLRDPGTGRFYLHVFDGWLTAREVSGPWQTVTGDTSRLDEIKSRVGGQGVDLLEGGESRPSLRSGTPVIYLSTTPAELIVLTGEPQYESIVGTQLLWVKNTAAPLLLDTASDRYFAVISGRWFRAPTLNGPWNYAPPDQLPGDLALIPDAHVLAPVRAAVPGTPQAREAVIANTVPQTATVRRSEARFEPTIDGEVQLRSIEGTSLLHVVNSPTPIIRVDADTWYAVDRGVWFTARSLEGPWEIATWVPPAIYNIPATSPLHYVTYVQVYGATPDEVFTGYQPGYLGTVVTPTGTVVQGTGAYVSPWIGNAWFGTPWTYGFGWSVGVGTFWPTWNPWCSPWWGPAWGGWWRPPVSGLGAPTRVGAAPGLGSTAGVGVGFASRRLGRLASAHLPPTSAASTRCVSSGRASAGWFSATGRASAGWLSASGRAATRGAAGRTGLGRKALASERTRLGPTIERERTRMGDRSVRAWRCAPGGGSASFPANLRQPAANSSAARWGDGYSRASLRRTDDCARTRTARRFHRSPVSRNRWRTGLPGSAADRTPAHGVPLSRAHGGVRFAECCSRPGRLSALQPRTGRCATRLWRHGIAGRARDDAPFRRPGAGYRCTRWRLS